MFAQVIEGKLADPERFLRLAEQWHVDVQPGAVGYLGGTWGVSPDGTGVLVARFESPAAAAENGARPEQGAWWREMEPAFAGATFHDCDEVDPILGGGSDEAGFVQVIEGRVKDWRKARAEFTDMDDEIAEQRPDVLGGIFAWHRDDGGFTQVVYFRSQEEARKGEASAGEPPSEYLDAMAAPPTFIDLPEPHFG